MKNLLTLLFTAVIVTGIYFNVTIAVVAYWIIMFFAGAMWVAICCSEDGLQSSGLNLKELQIKGYAIFASILTFPLYVYAMCINHMYNMLFLYVVLHLLVIVGQVKISKLLKEKTNDN